MARCAGRGIGRVKVAFVGIQTTELLTFRRELLREMAAAGHEVLAIAPEDDPVVAAELASLGVAFAPVHLHRAGTNPVRDSRTIVSLVRIFRRFRPDAVLVTAAKPVIYGSIAARLAGVPMRAAMITGIGSALSGGSSRKRVALAAALRRMYRTGLRGTHVVFFQNPDDEALFVALGLVGRGQRLVRIAGSGIDLTSFTPVALPPPPMTFLMVARLLRDKGLLEYLEAARRVKRAHPEARFQLLGPLDPNPEGITDRDVAEIRMEGVVDYLGETRDVRPYLAAAHVVVLPSYREGTPRSLLEAMAMGRPTITTDAPGCRETIEPGRNGLMVPVRDADALATAMLDLLAAPERLARMGEAGRLIVETRFDVREVDRTIMQAMRLGDRREVAPVPAGMREEPGGVPNTAEATPADVDLRDIPA
jgi:glycosyltransferase involved in cell wall biosynthesis